jgi:biopolymer transport protein ExbD
MDYDESEDYLDNQPLAEINIIPLVDVMLVLLILFMITAPLFTPHALKINLPPASSEISVSKPNIITLSIDAQGRLFWNKERIERLEFQQRLIQVVQQPATPELQLWADKITPYQQIAEVMSIAHQAGITRLGLITQPD